MSSFSMVQSPQEAGSAFASTVEGDCGGFTSTDEGERGGCTCSAHCRKRRMCSAQLPTAASFCRRHSSKASKGSAQAWRI